MTKNLLTALLIAGIPATAKAEPTVYYCQMTASAVIDVDGSVTEQNRERFWMKLDNFEVSFGDEGLMRGIRRDVNRTWRLSRNPSDPLYTEDFHSKSGELFFNGTVLTASFHGVGSNVTAFTAKCEDF